MQPTAGQQCAELSYNDFAIWTKELLHPSLLTAGAFVAGEPRSPIEQAKSILAEALRCLEAGEVIHAGRLLAEAERLIMNIAIDQSVQGTREHE